VYFSQRQVIEAYGPYGSQLPENYHVELEENAHFIEVTIRHEDIVDAILLKTNVSQEPEHIGGKAMIKLRDGEYLTKISGLYGNYSQQKNEVFVSTITIHTNFNPAGYGPYGTGKGVTNVQSFSSPNISDGPIVGFFGRSGNYIES
ncbi:Mannose/glucose-specific lectin, partial [Bienertia sinuspersici]